MAICGDRKHIKYRDTQAGGDPILSTRGVRDGALPGAQEHETSPTLLLHGSRRQWVGNVGFNDNHVERLGHFFPQLTTYEEANSSLGPQKDNIFAAEFTGNPNGAEASADAWLVINISAHEDGHSVVPLYDLPLP